MDEIVIAVIGSGALSALISGIFNNVAQRKKKKSADEIERDETLEGLNKGVQLLLLGEIERQTEKHMQRGSITRKELKWYLETYQTYKALKGDGYADDMKADVTGLPVKE